MATVKSSAEDLTLNADGSGNDILFQSNGSQVGSLTAEGVLTATSFAGSGANLTGLSSTLGGMTDVSMDITNFTDGLLIQPNSDGSAPTTGTLSTATGNVGIGKSTFGALTSGDYNVGIGYESLDALTTGAHNVAIGKGALTANTTADDNVAIGSMALEDNTTGGSNTAIGYNALNKNFLKTTRLQWNKLLYYASLLFS